MQGGAVCESPRGTHNNLLDSSTNEHAYIIQDSFYRRKVRREVGDSGTEKERRMQEDRREQEAERPEK
ncbi:hypothetical protein NDU88_002248 [Pleurodeles waltl]|uniref:Uncharacterized protein n=1 Tax=Pleurodeles waltl TaxID=8319 RepID=A0AAV7VE18_PLEWA|nr:hypothetical protein NDU88_002248 [Pleurodeles waltl]